MRLREHLPAHIFFIQGLFPPGQGATIGVDFMIKTVEVNGEKIKVSPLKISNIKEITSLFRCRTVALVIKIWVQF